MWRFHFLFFARRCSGSFKWLSWSLIQSEGNWLFRPLHWHGCVHFGLWEYTFATIWLTPSVHPHSWSVYCFWKLKLRVETKYNSAPQPCFVRILRGCFVIIGRFICWQTFSWQGHVPEIIIYCIKLNPITNVSFVHKSWKQALLWQFSLKQFF